MVTRPACYCCVCRDYVESYKVLKLEDKVSGWLEWFNICWHCLRHQWRDRTKLEPAPESPDEAAQQDQMFLRRIHVLSRKPVSLYRT